VDCTLAPAGPHSVRAVSEGGGVEQTMPHPDVDALGDEVLPVRAGVSELFVAAVEALGFVEFPGLKCQ
jgi:hypothetical protein